MPNLISLRPGKFGCVAVLPTVSPLLTIPRHPGGPTPWAIPSPFCLHVLTVILLCTRKQMKSITAHPVITGMAGKVLSWILSSYKVIGNPGGNIGFAPEGYHAPLVFIEVASPVPTVLNLTNINIGPEASYLFWRKVRDWSMFKAGHLFCLLRLGGLSCHGVSRTVAASLILPHECNDYSLAVSQ